MIPRFPESDVQYVTVEWLVSRRSAVRVTKLPRTSRRRERKTPPMIVRPRFRQQSALDFNSENEVHA